MNDFSIILILASNSYLLVRLPKQLVEGNRINP